MHSALVRTLGVLLLCTSLSAGAVPWPALCSNFTAVRTGEHPRLFFRTGDVPALRQRAAAPEGKAILRRLRFLLNGSDGETMPAAYNPVRGKPSRDGAGPAAPRKHTVSVGEKELSLLFLTKGAEPKVRVEGAGVLVGNQSVKLKDGILRLGVMAEEVREDGQRVAPSESRPRSSERQHGSDTLAG